MTAIQDRWEQILEIHQMPLKKETGEGEALYQGRVALTTYHVIDFGIAITDTTGNARCQIVYNNIAYYKPSTSYQAFLEAINRLNVELGTYYYFALDNDGRVFARYVVDVTEDTIDHLYDLLVLGSRLVKQAVMRLSNTYGTYVKL